MAKWQSFRCCVHRGAFLEDLAVRPRIHSKVYAADRSDLPGHQHDLCVVRLSEFLLTELPTTLL